MNTETRLRRTIGAHIRWWACPQCLYRELKARWDYWLDDEDDW